MGYKLTSFEQLDSWKYSQELSVYIYKITKGFPKEEQFGITNQLRRSSSSISANIAEGFGRSTNKDKTHFYTIAYGSLLETKSFLYLSNKLEYLPVDILTELIEQIVILQKIINASKKALS